MHWLILLISVFSSSAGATAKPKQRAPAQALIQGVIVVDQAAVYKASDFDSAVIGHTRRGKKFMMSPQVFGAFYRIQIKPSQPGQPGQVGYIPDTEIRPISKKKLTKDSSASAKGKPDQEEVKKKRPFEETKYKGISVAMINFREETMGLRPTASMIFFGFKAQGEGLLMEGMLSELNFQMAPSAPSYYEQATGVPSSGLILLMDGLLLTASPSGKNSLTFFGFGPMFKYSRIDTGVLNGGKTEHYSLNDMSLGLAFNLGISQRIGAFAARLELKYFWEKMQYYGFAITGQMEF